MKRALIISLVCAAFGFMGGLLFSTFTKTVVPTVKRQREAVPTRQVPASWRVDRYSPGHSQHVLNRAIDCNACHDPAKEDFSDVDFAMCTACHLEQTSHPHVDEQGQVTDCTVCHAFKYDSGVDSPWDCGRCHGPFDTPTHIGLARHTTLPCSTCHHPHEPIEETARQCDDCHTKIAVRHGNPKLSGSCIDCHGGHKLAAEATSCLECHGSRKPLVPATATFGGGHEDCASCHKPHMFAASRARQCGSCHQRQPVFAQGTAAAHRNCESCHQPHSVRSAGDSTCMSCHRKVESTHPVSEGSKCISCHEPHPKRASQIALQCSQCHEEARSERAFHAGGVECTGCHQPHRFDLSYLGDRALCKQCHSSQARLTSVNMGHASCTGCHKGTVHEPAGVLACSSCHEEKVQNSPKGHRDCAACHEPHSGSVSPTMSCGGCHKVQRLPGLHRLRDVPIGEGHTNCGVCHGVHQSRVRADRATCMTCHDDVANHQPEAKVCTGCHTFISGY